jgi:hypothetical protein
MTEQKKSPDATGPTTQHLTDTNSIADSVRFLKTLIPEETLTNGDPAIIEIRLLQTGPLPETVFLELSNLTENTLKRIFHKAENPKRNVYFGVGARINKKSGKKQDVGYLSTLWLDIDEKDGTPKEEAIKALGEWIFKPSYIIDSGHGIHAYWVLREPVEPSEFGRVEVMNKALAKQFNGDMRVVEIAHIMRVPASLNVKQEPFLPVKILQENDNRYELDDFEEVLPHEELAIKEYKLTGEKPNGNGKGITPGNFPDEMIEKVIDECAFLRHCKDDAKTLREIEWYEMITNLVALGASDSKIHELSAPYPKYTKRETEEKIKHARNDAPGPHTCANIEEHFEGCGECKWHASIKAPSSIPGKIRKPQKSESKKDIPKIEDVGLTVLGFNTKGDIVLWIDGSIITQAIKELNYLKLSMFLNRPVNQSEAGIIRESITREAGRKRLVNESKTVKNGVWRLDGDFYIISGRNVLKITDKVERIDYPVVCGRVVEYEENWLDVDLFETTFENPPDIGSVYQDIQAYVNQWNWKDQEMPGLMAAFLMVAPFQKLFTWRPWIYLIGRRGTGKSLFFEKAIELIYGNLATRLDKTTAYATIQEIEGTGKIPLFDDFEKDRKITALLSALKVSNRSGMITRGTPGKKNRKMKIDHIFWFNSILNSLEDAASFTRTVIFRLNEITRKIDVWSKLEAERTLANILVSVIKHWQDIDAIATRYKDTSIDRRVENVAYALALQAVATESDVINELPQFAVSYENISEDETVLFQAIMDTLTYPDTHTSKSDDALRTVRDLLMNEEPLESKGLKYVKTVKHGERLALRADQVKRYLLKDTDFYKYDISELLGNMDGVIKPSQETRQRFNGATAQCFLIPWEFITESGDHH